MRKRTSRARSKIDSTFIAKRNSVSRAFGSIRDRNARGDVQKRVQTRHLIRVLRGFPHLPLRAALRRVLHHLAAAFTDDGDGNEHKRCSGQQYHFWLLTTAPLLPAREPLRRLILAVAIIVALVEVGKRPDVPLGRGRALRRRRGLRRRRLALRRGSGRWHACRRLPRVAVSASREECCDYRLLRQF